jgi:hypothetical protein
VSGPRNKPAWRRGQHHVALIRAALEAHAARCPLGKPPTAFDLLRETHLRLSPRRVQQIVQRIQTEAEIAALDVEIGCARRTSSADSTGAV